MGASTIPVGLCQCGCGQATTVADRTNSRLGHLKGHPVSFIPGHHVRLLPRRPRPSWPPQLCACGCGEYTAPAPKTTKRRGFVEGQPQRFIQGHQNRVRGMSPSHYPNIGHEKAHLAMARRALGRPLPHGAQVHHVDGNPNNHDARNLVICQDQSYHQLLHARALVVRAGGNPNTSKVCRGCWEIKPFEAFRIDREHHAGRGSRCKSCVNRRARNRRKQGVAA